MAAYPDQISVVSISVHIPDGATVTFQIPDFNAGSSDLSKQARDLISNINSLVESLKEIPPDAIEWY